ncbi:MAG: ribokinase [Candidatus Aminicenantes bacterium]|nr:MAG: ribokinase [Candidatus Aminicenantes bacterium]
MKDHLIIVPGGLNTDIIGLGVDNLLAPGELTLGGKLKIGPGGKARNMAQMAAAYLGEDTVAMIGRSSKDPFGLWKIPLQSLNDAGVDTTFIKVLSFEEAGQKYPGIALIPVDEKGRNQIYVLPGVNEDFSTQDVEEARELFRNEGQKKILLLALEIPLETAKYCIQKAASNEIRVVLDPGGMSTPAAEIFDEKIFLLKPNEHETKILTGLPVDDFESAKRAADILLSKGIQNILITHGAEGAYLFNNDVSLHIRVPVVEDYTVHDETGCGDQVTAIMASGLAEGRDLVEAAELAVRAGTLQFNKAGVQPISRQELLKE